MYREIGNSQSDLHLRRMKGSAPQTWLDSKSCEWPQLPHHGWHSWHLCHLPGHKIKNVTSSSTVIFHMVFCCKTWMLLTDNNNTDGNDKNGDNNNDDNNDNNQEKVGSYISIYMHLKHWLTMSWKKQNNSHSMNMWEQKNWNMSKNEYPILNQGVLTTSV